MANPIDGSAIAIYNLDPAKRTSQPIVDVNDPNQKYVYNGIDVNFQARIGAGRLLGGITTERWVIDNCSLDDSERSDSGRVLSGHNRRTLLQAERLRHPVQTQAKLTGFYPLPFYGVRVSGVFMSFPGDRAFTNYTVTPAISPGLTQASITVPLVAPGDKYDAQRFQTDFSAWPSPSVLALPSVACGCSSTRSTSSAPIPFCRALRPTVRASTSQQYVTC